MIDWLNSIVILSTLESMVKLTLNTFDTCDYWSLLKFTYSRKSFFHLCVRINILPLTFNTCHLKGCFTKIEKVLNFNKSIDIKIKLTVLNVKHSLNNSLF